MLPIREGQPVLQFGNQLLGSAWQLAPGKISGLRFWAGGWFSLAAQQKGHRAHLGVNIEEKLKCNTFLGV